MDKQYFYKFTHYLWMTHGLEEEYASFFIRLTEEQRNFLYNLVNFHYRNAKGGETTLYEAIDLSLDDFYEKYHIQGSLEETPFEWGFEVD